MNKFLCFLVSLLMSVSSLAQNVTVLPSGITPAVNGTYPRLSYEAIMAYPSPALGDIAFDTTFLCLRVYNGSKWVCTYQSPNDPNPNQAAISSAGGIFLDAGHDIAVDASGNIYITGYFSHTATFGAANITSAGGRDIFVAKYDRAGTLQWVQSAGGTSTDEGNDIAVDASGNVYITGFFSGTATFGATSKTSAGGKDIFVAKYNSSGMLQGVQSAGGTSSDEGNGIAVDASGNIFIAGSYQETATFGSTSKTSLGSTDIFVAKYNNGGSLQWVQSTGGSVHDKGGAIVVDASGNIYVTGYFYGTVTFGTTTMNGGAIDAFLAKYDNAGTLQWVQSIDGASSDEGYDIAVDASGNVYMTGLFSGTATFGATSKISAGLEDIFLVKYDSAGTMLWVQSAGGSIYDGGRDIEVDANGSVYIIGNFGGIASFGAISKTSVGDNDIFVAKYDSAGILKWVQSAGGVDYDFGGGIAVDTNGNVYYTGYFSSTASFGATSKTSSGSYEIFLARLQD